MGDVVGSIAGSAIEVLLQNLISLCKEEISLIRNFKKNLDKLKKSLEMIRDFLDDAEKKQVTEKAVKRWLINLEAVVFDADNLLDELNYEVHHRKMEPGKKLKKKVRALLSTCKMAHDIRSINMKLNSINQEAANLGLHAQLSAYIPGVGSELTLAERETASNPDPFVVGRENYVSSMVEILTTHHDEQQVFSVIPIVGMGGLGKTTLAKLVFHDKKIEAHFKKRIWVYVSESFDEMALLKKILESLAESSYDDSKISKDALLRKLRENLEAKKYLLVLDDVWTEETKKLDDFIDTLASITSVKGNGIIVTTRSEIVASIVGKAHIQKLSELPNEDCWSIIKEKAFSKGCDIPLDFEDIGKKIASKCQGLPLAAKIVGGVLRGKPIVEWRSIERDELSNLGDEANTMRKILKLSLDNLPHQSLKKCFAFCAIFPKGYRIKKSLLIHLWMAEGLLESDDMETLGDKYVDLLLYNSLLQVGDRSYDGSIEFYTMHDLVCDLALSVLKESGPIRYIYLRSITDIPKGEARNVRSLIFEGEISDDNMLSDFKYLRGLVLIGYDNEQVPKMEHLIHLRYLDMLRTPIGCSPMLISKLYLLQTFRAKVASNKLPEITKLLNLRHVEVEGIEETGAETQLGPEVVASPSSATTRFPNLKTSNIYRMHSSSFLENLLVNVTSLTDLSLYQLQGLVSLPDMFFDNNQYLTHLTICRCGNLTHMPLRFGISIRKVYISECLALEGLPEIPHCLEKLNLWNCPNIKSIPYNPSCGSPSLRELTISRCGGLTELPIGLLESCSLSLESVTLWELRSLTNMGVVITCLQKMPRLTSLKVDLKHLANDGFPIEIVVGSFNSLRDLWIRGGSKIWQRLQDLLQHLNALQKLTLWDIEMEAVWLGKLPSLRKLELHCCPNLRSLPSYEALKHRTEVEVFDCPLLNLESDDDVMIVNGDQSAGMNDVMIVNGDQSEG